MIYRKQSLSYLDKINEIFLIFTSRLSVPSILISEGPAINLAQVLCPHNFLKIICLCFFAFFSLNIIMKFHRKKKFKRIYKTKKMKTKPRGTNWKKSEVNKQQHQQTKKEIFYTNKNRIRSIPQTILLSYIHIHADKACNFVCFLIDLQWRRRFIIWQWQKK